MKAFCPSCRTERQVPFRASLADRRCRECNGTLVAPPRERKPLDRKAKPRQQRAISEASPAQRAKVVAFPFCLACGRGQSSFVSIDPAHVIKRSLGGCDDPACVIPLCRTFGGGCHGRFDEGELDLLKRISGRWPAELIEYQHALTHALPVEVIERLAGARTQWSDHAVEVVGGL